MKCIKLKGDRLEVSRKRWGKVKYGYGWVTRKTVVWKCPHENRDADLGDASKFSVRTVSSQLPGLRKPKSKGGSEVCGISQIEGMEGLNMIRRLA